MSNKQKKQTLLPIVSGGFVLLLVLVLVLTSKKDEKGKTGAGVANAPGESVEVAGNLIDYEVDKEGNLIISTAGISSEASFIDYEENGTLQQIFLVKATDDSIRVAFNTCQVCNGSPWAYFTQDEGKFICQNCGNQYSVDQVGKQRGGCNPIPITSEDYELVEDQIIITKDFMSDYSDAFSNWKNFK